jgi:hypothetical protein
MRRGEERGGGQGDAAGQQCPVEAGEAAIMITPLAGYWQDSTVAIRRVVS